jgi:serine/threonine protein kinase
MDEPADLAPLPPGTRLHAFVIREPLGRGGVGIVYAADHEILHETFAIKEFLPHNLAHRVAGNRVAALPGKELIYDALRRKFLEEGQTLVQLARPHPHPNLVQVTDAFHENDTVYLCMRFEQGEPLDAVIESRGPLGESELRRLLLPLLDGLEHAHAHQVWHRDIKPSNILVRADGTPLLIDFGAAHRDRADGVVSVIAQYTPNFAASEQLYGGTQGPWTDIYCLAATLYYVMTGHPPPSRLRPGWRSQCPGYSRQFLQALEAGLQFDPERRPETVASWRSLFEAPDSLEMETQWLPDPGEAPTQTWSPPFAQNTEQGESRIADSLHLECTQLSSERTSEETRPEPTPPRSRRWILPVGLLALLLLAGLPAGFLLHDRLDTQPGDSLSDITRLSERLNLAGQECAQVELRPHGDRDIALSGYLRDARQLTTLLEQIRLLAPDLEVETRELAFAAPFCDLLAATDTLAPANSHYPGMPIIRFNRLDRVYHEDQYLVINVVNPGTQGGYLYLDFVDGNRQAVHLFPTEALPDNFIAPGSLIRIGARDDAECEREPDACFVISRPHGNNLILATWSDAPILSRWRSPQSEPVDDYLVALRAAIKETPSDTPSRRAVSYHFFTTTD